MRLTWEDKERIKKMALEKKPYKFIASRFSITVPHVSYIVHHLNIETRFTIHTMSSSVDKYKKEIAKMQEAEKKAKENENYWREE